MGVLNVTPDSFSDGGRWFDPDSAVGHGVNMLDQGADLLDIGGESTRPGSLPVGPDEQIRRVTPVIRQLRQLRPDVTISIDTSLASVAAAALDAGANLINDITGGTADPALLSLAAARGCPIVLMHIQGTPLTMQESPAYTDVLGEVKAFLARQRSAAVGAGVEPARVLLDPGIGFGKTLAHNLTLLRRLNELKELGSPLLLGVSRKGFIGRLTGKDDPDGRIFGTAASVAWCLANGADIVRVHDVEAMTQVVRVLWAIQSLGDAPPAPRR